MSIYRRVFRNDVLLSRNAVNLAHIWSDPQKRGIVIATAEAALPGPWSALTAAAISEAWALAESENDCRLLEHGRKVPLVKTTATWATDLESLAKNGHCEYIDTNPKTGLTYHGYLQAFLFLEEKSLKLERVMDLIQIDIQGRYDRDFLIKEHNLGFYFKASVDGREYAYDERY